MDDGSGLMVIVLWLAATAGLAFIPVNIVQSKGRTNLGLWWCYGAALFIVALIHALLLPDPRAEAAAALARSGSTSADEIRKFAQLKDDGLITEAEFERKKVELLNS